VVPIGELMGEESSYSDDQIVSVAGIVQAVKMKSTRNNSMMAYVAVEDDTAAIEMLAFSNVLNQYGGYLRENSPVVVTGRLSIRDEKEPQIVINRARPISDFAGELPAEPEEQAVSAGPVTGRLYLSVPTEESTVNRKVRAIVQMFPGNCDVFVKYQDTQDKKHYSASISLSMLRELVSLLGEGKVFLFLPKDAPVDKGLLNTVKNVLGQQNVVLK
jgi:DNA polymerase-3 subunit alpha